MRRFDVVTEEDQGDEQVVDVGFVNREEDHGHVLLQRQDNDFTSQNQTPFIKATRACTKNHMISLHFLPAT